MKSKGCPAFVSTFQSSTFRSHKTFVLSAFWWFSLLAPSCGEKPHSYSENVSTRANDDDAEEEKEDEEEEGEEEEEEEAVAEAVVDLWNEG